MSSVQDIRECPQCKGILVTDFDCNTLEEYCHCSRCGRTEEWVIVRNENGEAVLDENGHIRREYHEIFGYGSACFAGNKGISQMFSFSAPIDEDVKKIYLETIEKSDINKEDCYLTSWDAENNTIVAIFGKLPETFQEYEERAAQSE